VQLPVFCVGTLILLLLLSVFQYLAEHFYDVGKGLPMGSKQKRSMWKYADILIGQLLAVTAGALAESLASFHPQLFSYPLNLK
jgi:hypothetical protein